MEEEDHAIIILGSLPKGYEHFVHRWCIISKHSPWMKWNQHWILRICKRKRAQMNKWERDSMWEGGKKKERTISLDASLDQNQENLVMEVHPRAQKIKKRSKCQVDQLQEVELRQSRRNSIYICSRHLRNSKYRVVHQQHTAL